MDIPLVSKDLSPGHRAVVSQPECLYGPQVVDRIMRKPGNKTIIKIDPL